MNPIAFGSALGVMALIFFGLQGLVYLIESIPTAEAVSAFFHGGPAASWLLWYVKIFLGYGGLVGCAYYVITTFWVWLVKVVSELWQESLESAQDQSEIAEQEVETVDEVHDEPRARMELHEIHDEDLEILQMTVDKLQGFIPLIDGGSYRITEWEDARGGKS